MVKHLVEVPETVSQDRIQQRTVEQIVDAPVPQAVEELAEVSKVFSQDRIQQRAVEQTIENPAISLAGMIVEMPVTRKTQQLVNTHVQHVVDTVEVEKPKITELTVQRKKPIIQEKMNQVTKPIEIPQVQFLDEVDEIPVVAQRQIPIDQTVRKTVETPQLQVIDKVVDDPVVQVPRVQVLEKTVEISQLQAAEKVVETRETQTIQSIQTSESSVHLTGAMKPDDPDAKIKFFADSWYSTCRRYGSARTEDARFDRSPLPGLFENGQESEWRAAPPR